jgi:hypothetical protein
MHAMPPIAHSVFMMGDTNERMILAADVASAMSVTDIANILNIDLNPNYRMRRLQE